MICFATIAPYVIIKGLDASYTHPNDSASCIDATRPDFMNLTVFGKPWSLVGVVESYDSCWVSESCLLNFIAVLKAINRSKEAAALANNI